MIFVDICAKIVGFHTQLGCKIAKFLHPPAYHYQQHPISAGTTTPKNVKSCYIHLHISELIHLFSENKPQGLESILYNDIIINSTISRISHKLSPLFFYLLGQLNKVIPLKTLKRLQRGMESLLTQQVRK